MRRKFLSSAKGLTLVELLLALSLIGVVSVLVVGVLVSGMNSYRSVNKQISLHDEANAIMTKFSNEIFVATKAEQASDGSDKLITIWKYGSDEPITLEFAADGTAQINHVQINSSLVEISYADSTITVDEVKGTVLIHLKITDNNEQSFQLTEEVSYVNVKQGEGG